jgi:hypothetical protein
MRVIRGLFVVVVLMGALWALFARGNPGGISDARYAQFQRMAPPKLLYSCTRKPTPESFLPQARECWKSGRAGCDEKVHEWVEAAIETSVDFVSGPGTSSYDQMLRDAMRSCARQVRNMAPGEFKVLEADKN